MLPVFLYHVLVCFTKYFMTTMMTVMGCTFTATIKSLFAVSYPRDLLSMRNVDAVVYSAIISLKSQHRYDDNNNSNNNMVHHFSLNSFVDDYQPPVLGALMNVYVSVCLNHKGLKNNNGYIFPHNP